MENAMQFDLTSLVLGILVGAVIALAFAAPRVGRALACIASISLLAIGVGCITWGTASLVGVDEFRSIGFERLNISTPVEALGLGGGTLFGGVLGLYLAASASKR